MYVASRFRTTMMLKYLPAARWNIAKEITFQHHPAVAILYIQLNNLFYNTQDFKLPINLINLHLEWFTPL